MQAREPARSGSRSPADAGASARADAGSSARGDAGSSGGADAGSSARGDAGSSGGADAGSSASAVGSSAGADAARARLASELRRRGHALSPAVQDAFATVPRHVFVPEIGPAAAYRDEALIIKCGPDGMPISSSSQPAMMAIMLDQLGLERGHRVLEIGTGSGYNAAVMSAVVGPGGEVVTIDIDPDLVARARASLLAAGADQVSVRCADGGYGDPDGAPFDRVIVTAGAWDIAPAWLDQLGPGGRLVLPLSIRGIQLSVGLERTGRAWLSTSARRCGFVRMLGAFAGPEEVRRLGEARGVAFQVSDGKPVDTGALAAALAGESVDKPVPVALADIAELAELDLWLTISAGALDRLTILSAGGPAAAATLPFGALISSGADADRLGIGMLLSAGWGDEPADVGHEPGLARSPEAAQRRMPAPVPEQDLSRKIRSATVRGFGPGGPELAARLAALSGTWATLGRPGSHELEVLVWAAGDEPSRPPDNRLVLRRPSVTIAAGWPARHEPGAQARQAAHCSPAAAGLAPR